MVDNDLSEMISKFMLIQRGIRIVQDVCLENMPLCKKREENKPVTLDRKTFETVAMAAIIGLQILFKAVESANSVGIMFPAMEGITRKQGKEMHEKVVKRIMNTFHCSRGEAIAFMERAAGTKDPYN